MGDTTALRLTRFAVHRQIANVSVLKRIIFPVLALAFFVAGCGRAPVDATAEQQRATNLEWLEDFGAAKAKAQAENKLLLIDFTGSDWCPPCKMLSSEVFSRPEFSEYAARNLVLLEVDFPRMKKQSDDQKVANQMLARQFGIEGFPTIVIIDSKGKILGHLGYMRGGAARFIAEIEKLRS
jgi:protein disulfide-isomerase